MNIFRGLLLLGLAAGVALAGTVCPTSPGTGTATSNGAFAHVPDAAATGCNVLITIAANGSISTTIPDASAYDGSDDTLVGVVNNSSVPVGSLNLTGSGIFGLEGDGICVYTFTGNSYCSASAVAGTDPQDYYGPTSTFTNFSSGNSGTVLFSPAIPAGGGSTYFSLEGAPTANLVVSTGGGPAGVPAPSTFILLGIGLTLLVGWSLRSQIRLFGTR